MNKAYSESEWKEFLAGFWSTWAEFLSEDSEQGEEDRPKGESS